MLLVNGMQSSSANRQRFWVTSKMGLHLRAAALLAETASRFDCAVSVRHGGREVDAKSVMGIATLGAAFGAEVVVTTEGADGREAMKAIAEVFATDFDGPDVGRSGCQHADSRGASRYGIVVAATAMEMRT